ncbi:MAG: hypothetical protein ACRCWG_03140 [Sarcina sp.]
MIMIFTLIIAIILAVILSRINKKNNRKPIGKFKITILVIAVWLVLGATTNLIFPKEHQKEIQSTTTSEVPSPVVKQIKSIKSIPLGTQATTKTGKIYVDMNKSFEGIKGMSKPELLMVLPSLSGNGTDIGSHGVAYYNSDLTKESLANFYNEIVTKSKCDYITLVNIKDNTTGIVITSSGAFSKGSLAKGSDYELSKTSEMGLLSDNNKTVEWQKV